MPRALARFVGGCHALPSPEKISHNSFCVADISASDAKFPVGPFGIGWGGLMGRRKQKLGRQTRNNAPSDGFFLKRRPRVKKLRAYEGSVEPSPIVLHGGPLAWPTGAHGGGQFCKFAPTKMSSDGIFWLARILTLKLQGGFVVLVRSGTELEGRLVSSPLPKLISATQAWRQLFVALEFVVGS